MVNYQNSKIYKIVCNLTGETYYGSTTVRLCNRLAKHRENSKYSCKSKSIIDRENYSCILVEEYPCENKDQLYQRERWYIENNVCINKCIPLRTEEDRIKYSKEYYNKNRESKLVYVNEYREMNREELNEKRREKIVCECGAEITKSAFSRHKKSKKHLSYLNIGNE